MIKILIIIVLFLFIPKSVFCQAYFNDSLKLLFNQNKTEESDFSTPKVLMSPDEKYFVFFGLDHTIDFYELKTLKLVNQIITERNGIYYQEVIDVNFLEEKYLIVRKDDLILIYDLQSNKNIFKYSIDDRKIIINELNGIFAKIENNSLTLLNKSLELLFQYPELNRDRSSTVFMSSKSGEWMINWPQNDGNFTCVNKNTNAIIAINQNDHFGTPFCFNNAETLLFYGSKNGNINCVNLITGIEKTIIESKKAAFASSCAFSDRSNNLIITGQISYTNTKITCYNILNGNEKSFEGETILPTIDKFVYDSNLISDSSYWDIKNVTFTNSCVNPRTNCAKCTESDYEEVSMNIKQSLASCYSIDSCKICIAKNNFTYICSPLNKVIYSVIFFQNNNYLVKLPNSPYYMCSKDASKMLHYVTPSLKVIGFEQLDPVYNRPDIVLDSIGKYFGGADPELVANYRQSWEKRIDRLGLDKEKLGKGEIAVPSAEILDADDIAYENKNGVLEIKVSANDAKYPLRRFNVFVNEVPLYGSAGISIAHLNKQVWDTTISVPLSVGENKIQVSVMNELGLENFKYPTYVNYTPENNIVAKTYYIGIGVNEFAQSAHNLKYCVKDVRDLAESFATENSNTDTLLFTDQQVTRENILALKTMMMKTTVNDKVIISCSSHGLLDDSLNFYLAMHDVDFKNPKLRGLKYEELESLLDGIPARQKLLLLDACNSGENDKSELLKKEIEQNLNTMDTTQLLAARGRVIKLEEENTNNFKKINELFVNVRNNTGSVIISAAGGQQSALEAIELDGKIIENGAFTYSILECLTQNKGKELKVNTLKQYAEKRVEEITNGK
ncbi:MAG: caspase domain-containing protein, partial [Bacteroidota bacterium]